MLKDEKIQYWKKLFEAQAASGLTKAAYCKSNQIAISTFYVWTKKVNEKPQSKKPKLIPLVFSESKTDANLAFTLPNGYHFSFPASLSPDTLQQFLRVLSA